MFLPYLKDLPSHNSSTTNQTLTIAITAQNLEKMSDKLLMSKNDSCSPSIPELLKLAHILSFHEELRNAKIRNLMQNTNFYRKNKGKHCITTFSSKNNFNKSKHNKLKQTEMIKNKIVAIESSLILEIILHLHITKIMFFLPKIMIHQLKVLLIMYSCKIMFQVIIIRFLCKVDNLKIFSSLREVNLISSSKLLNHPISEICSWKPCSQF